MLSVSAPQTAKLSRSREFRRCLARPNRFRRGRDRAPRCSALAALRLLQPVGLGLPKALARKAVLVTEIVSLSLHLGGPVQGPKPRIDPSLKATTTCMTPTGKSNGVGQNL